MDQTLLDIAGAARFLLDSCDISEPYVDPIALAESWGISVIDGSMSFARGDIIHVDARKPLSAQRFDIAHELGHIVAAHVGLDRRCERTASGIASATLMPDGAFKRDLSTYAWDLEALSQLYGVSFEVAARRVAEVRGAIVCVWENGAPTHRLRSPWLQGRGFSSTPNESERIFASECAAWKCHLQESDGLLRAYWDTSEHSVRVVVVSEIDAWEQRCQDFTAVETAEIFGFRHVAQW